MSKFSSIGCKRQILSCPALEMLADASGIDCAFASRLLRGPPWSEQNLLAFAQSGKFRHTLKVSTEKSAEFLKKSLRAFASFAVEPTPDGCLMFDLRCKI